MSDYNESLIKYGKEHGDPNVRELAEQFENYRCLVSRFIGSEEPITVTQTSGRKNP